MRGMGMDASCCQMRGSDAAVTPVPPFPPEHLQKPAFVPRAMSLPTVATPAAGWRNALKTPPPKFPPGGISNLRI